MLVGDFLWARSVFIANSLTFVNKQSALQILSTFLKMWRPTAIRSWPSFIVYHCKSICKSSHYHIRKIAKIRKYMDEESAKIVSMPLLLRN